MPFSQLHYYPWSGAFAIKFNLIPAMNLICNGRHIVVNIYVPTIKYLARDDSNVGLMLPSETVCGKQCKYQLYHCLRTASINSYLQFWVRIRKLPLKKSRLPMPSCNYTYLFYIHWYPRINGIFWNSILPWYFSTKNRISPENLQLSIHVLFTLIMCKGTG